MELTKGANTPIEAAEILVTGLTVRKMVDPGKRFVQSSR